VPRPSPQTTRVVSIVNLLTERAEQGATLTEVARHVGQTPAACVHVLAALVSAGFVVRHPEDRRYRLGPALVAPGRVAASRFPALDATRTAMVELSRTVGLPVLAFRRDGSYARLVEIVFELHRPAPSIRIGDVLPIEAPLGAIFVAWAGERAIERWLTGWSHDSSARAALRARLDRAREQGFTVELRPPLPFVHELARLLARGQDLRRAERLRTEAPDVGLFLVDHIRPAARYDVASLGVPVFRRDGGVDLALSVMGFSGAHTGRELLSIAERAKACAHALSKALVAPR
jgi:DNA-binding IclR family transcriptional regulator